RAVLPVRRPRGQRRWGRELRAGVAGADTRAQRRRPVAHRLAVRAGGERRLADVVRLGEGLAGARRRAASLLPHPVRRIARRHLVGPARPRLHRLRASGRARDRAPVRGARRQRVSHVVLVARRPLPHGVRRVGGRARVDAPRRSGRDRRVAGRLGLGDGRVPVRVPAWRRPADAVQRQRLRQDRVRRRGVRSIGGRVAVNTCPRCGSPRSALDSGCGACGFQPSVRDGIVYFAPGSAGGTGGDAVYQHEALFAAEQSHFWFRGRERLVVWALRRHFPSAATLLDVGCGRGSLLAGIRARVPALRLAGAELLDTGLKFARQRLAADIGLYQLDATALPFDREFYVVTSCDVLEHIDDDRAVLREIFRAVVPGGGIIVTV